MVFFDCFPLILHVLTSLIKRILWLKFFHRQNVGREQEGVRNRGTCCISPWSTFVEVYHFLQCSCHHITFSNNFWNRLSIPHDIHYNVHSFRFMLIYPTQYSVCISVLQFLGCYFFSNIVSPLFIPFFWKFYWM